MARDLDEKKLLRARILKDKVSYNPDTYEYDDKFVPESSPDFNSAHTTMEMIRALETDKSIDISGSFLQITKDSKGSPILTPKRFHNRESFFQAWGSNKQKFKEFDSFDTSSAIDTAVESISDDFIPLLGGPFYKQLYQFDYLRMHSLCFFAYHHDPIAKAAVNIIHDFVLGRGFKIKSEDLQSSIIWDAFSEVNDFDKHCSDWLKEMEVYGEQMTWFLPNHLKGAWFGPQAAPPTLKGAIIPRITLIDPSAIWEIVTYLESQIPIYYQWIAPTQYQTFTAPDAPGNKFIFQQIPSEQVIHERLNAVSNEKRGRSDLFAVLGYLKRLRDANNYSILGALKSSAWSIDTSIEGSQEDVDAYAESQQEVGTIPPAGSEFIHSNKITRQYIGNEGSGRGGNSNAFEWCLSMICMGLRIPISYFGTHLSGGQTRASALTSTEPVTKMFEARQILLERHIKKLHKRVTGKDCEVTFPELITQDRSAKIRDIMSAQRAGYISLERAAQLVAKELNITEFEFKEEQLKIQSEEPIIDPTVENPLSAPGKEPATKKPSALTGDEKKQIKDQHAN